MEKIRGEKDTQHLRAHGVGVSLRCVPSRPCSHRRQGPRPRSSASPQPGDQSGGSCQGNLRGSHRSPSCPGTRAQSGTTTRPPALHANRHDSATIPAVRKEINHIPAAVLKDTGNRMHVGRKRCHKEARGHAPQPWKSSGRPTRSSGPKGPALHLPADRDPRVGSQPSRSHLPGA